jgi:hypothetical protein
VENVILLASNVDNEDFQFRSVIGDFNNLMLL